MLFCPSFTVWICAADSICKQSFPIHKIGWRMNNGHKILLSKTKWWQMKYHAWGMQHGRHSVNHSYQQVDYLQLTLFLINHSQSINNLAVIQGDNPKEIRAHLTLEELCIAWAGPGWTHFKSSLSYSTKVAVRLAIGPYFQFYMERYFQPWAGMLSVQLMILWRWDCCWDRVKV